MKPKIFTYTSNRLPTDAELEEINSSVLSLKEIANGIIYTIVGKGITSAKNKELIIEFSQLLITKYPNNTGYKKILNYLKQKYK